MLRLGAFEYERTCVQKTFATRWSPTLKYSNIHTKGERSYREESLVKSELEKSKQKTIAFDSLV